MKICCGYTQLGGADPGRYEWSVGSTDVPSAAHSQAGPLHARTVPV